MHLHAAINNAQPGGEMSGFLRLGAQEIFGAIRVNHGKAVLTDAPGLGIEVNPKRLADAAISLE
jgi:L-alanine-DL-glutamate epimerase-like enolase superfamily enzyme